MDRKNLLQELVRAKNYEHYLEIGTYKGKSFLPLVCKNKVAVDPRFRFNPLYFIKWHLKNPTNFRNRYYQMSSDDFFERKSAGKMELIFVDGLHTFEASLKDVLNSLQHIDTNGIILLHDCFPPNKASATPASSHLEASKMDIPGWTNAWCGDIWKTIYYLRTKYYDELEVFVLDTDHGLGIVRKKISFERKPDIDTNLFQEINLKSYEELCANAESMIGLKNKSYFNSFLKDFTRINKNRY